MSWLRSGLTPNSLVLVAMAGILLPPRSSRAASPGPGECIAASNSSLTMANAHKLRAERAQLLVCASVSCPAEVRKDCARRVEEIGGEIPTVIFEVKDAAGRDLDTVKVTMDGEVLTERLDGTALSLDPGEHTFAFEAAGQSSMTKKLTIRQSQRDRLEVVTFGPPVSQAPAPPPPQPRPAVPPPTQVAPSPPPSQPSPSSMPPSDSPHGMGTQKILGLTAGGVGVAGLVVGGVFGALTASAISKQKSDCASAANCPNYSQAASDHSTWSTDGTVSTVAFVAGGLLVAGGATLFFTAGDGPVRSSGTGLVVAPSLGPGAAGMLIRGEF